MILPTQKNTYKEKTKKNYSADGSYRTWAMDTADYYIEQGTSGQNNEKFKEIQALVEGIIDPQQYKHLLNPFGLTKEVENIKVGAVLKTHNIIKGVISLLMGEYGRRSHEYSVIDFNGEDENKYKEGLSEVLNSYYKQEFVNELNSYGVPTGVPTKEQPSPEEVEEEYKQSFDNLRVIRGQDAIDYIKYEQEVEDKFLDMYYDWITTGSAFSYKCVRHDDVDYEYVPLSEIYIPHEPHIRYIEDASFVVRRRFLPINKILDTYGDVLDEEDLNYLNDTYSGSVNLFSPPTVIPTNGKGFIHLGTLNTCDNSNIRMNIDLNSHDNTEVCHVVWRSWKRYGILTYINDIGEEDTIEVDDSYKLNKSIGDISLVWKWESCLWETTRIAGRVYTLSREVTENRAELNNKGAQKLPYNGPISRSKTGTIQSIVTEGEPYQILTNILHYQLEKLINKNKDKIIVFPYGLVPRKKGIDTTKQMHHADATGILWADESAPNASYAGQMIKVLDVGLGEYINDIVKIISYIKQEYWDTIGMNAQRYSDVAQGAGKSVTEQAIARSSIITYELTRKMDKFIEREYQGFLDISKLAWINGIKKQYILSNGAQAFLNLNPDDAIYHLESDYGVFVKDSAELSENLQAYRGLASAYAQQSTAMSATAEIFSNNSMERIKNIVKKIEEAEKKHELRKIEDEGKNKKELQTLINENEEANREVKRYEADMQYKGTVESAAIRSSINDNADAPRPANDVERMLAEDKIRGNAVKEQQDERRLNQKDDELALLNKNIENKQAQNKNTNN